MALATALGFVSGYLVGLVPLVRTGMSWVQTFRAIWIGETVSIAAMGSWRARANRTGISTAGLDVGRY